MEKYSLAGQKNNTNNVTSSVFPSQAELSPVEQLAISAAVLPEQFYHAPTRACGEVELMRAVLEEAVDCFQKQFVKSGRRAQRLAREAEEWLFSDEVSWPFSFVNICAVLAIEPGYIRLKLKRWSDNARVQTKESQPSASRSWSVPHSFPALRPTGA